METGTVSRDNIQTKEEQTAQGSSNGSSTLQSNPVSACGFQVANKINVHVS